MTLSEVEAVILYNKVLYNRTAIEQAEARNHQAAFHWLIDELANNPLFEFNEDLILNIHLRLMNGILSDAGKYRRQDVRIMGSYVPPAIKYWVVGSQQCSYVSLKPRYSIDYC